MASSADSPQKRVLVVDDSKFVRTTFAAILKRSFGVREEVDGEAAWQAVETDPSLVMVFTDLEMPQLDGFSLLARIRGSEDARIKALPVVVISGHDEAENKQRAKELGANDFIAKTADAPEVLSRLDNVLRLVRAESSATHDPLTGALTPHYLLVEGRKHYAHARRHGRDLSVAALRLESYEGIARSCGKELAEVVVARVAKLIMDKVRTEDSVARIAPATFVVVSPGTSGAQMLVVAQRLRRELAEAKVRYHDKTLTFSASHGLSSAGADPASSVEELVRLALQRLSLSPPAAPPKPKATHLPAELERLVRMLESVDTSRLGDAAEQFARRLTKIAASAQARRR